MNHPDAANRHRHTSLANINNKVLAVSDYATNNQTEIFDIDTNTWTTKSPFPFCAR